MAYPGRRLYGYVEFFGRTQDGSRVIQLTWCLNKQVEANAFSYLIFLLMSIYYTLHEIRIARCFLQQLWITIRMFDFRF